MSVLEQTQICQNSSERSAVVRYAEDWYREVWRGKLTGLGKGSSQRDQCLPPSRSPPSILLPLLRRTEGKKKSGRRDKVCADVQKRSATVRAKDREVRLSTGRKSSSSFRSPGNFSLLASSLTLYLERMSGRSKWKVILRNPMASHWVQRSPDPKLINYNKTEKKRLHF